MSLTQARATCKSYVHNFKKTKPLRTIHRRYARRSEALMRKMAEATKKKDAEPPLKDIDELVRYHQVTIDKGITHNKCAIAPFACDV